MDSLTSLSSDKENDQYRLNHPPAPRLNKKHSFRAPGASSAIPTSYIAASPKMSKPSITQEYYQSYSPVPMTTTTKPFPSFQCPTPQKAEYLPLEIEEEEDFLALSKLEEELHAHQTKNLGFTAFIITNIIFMLIVTILIYMMHTTTSTLGKSSTNEHRVSGDGFSVEVDSLTHRYFVIDHNPLPNFPFAKAGGDATTGNGNGGEGGGTGSDENNNAAITNHVILADGLFHRNLNNNGWNYLSIETMDLKSFAYRLNTTKGNTLSTSEQLSTIREQYIKNMKALGYLEGYLTCNEIKQYYENFYTDSFTNMNLTREAVDFLLLNYQWMSIQSEQYYAFSSYWLVVKGLLSQLNGLVQGARDGCSSLGNDYTVNTPGINHNNNNHDGERFEGKNKKGSANGAWAGAGAGGASAKPFMFQSIHSTSDFEKPDLHYNDVFLPSMHKRPELIHFLLVNANGDLFQIKQKYEFIERDPDSVDNNAINRQDDDDDKVSDEADSSSSTTTAAPVTPTPAADGNNNDQAAAAAAAAAASTDSGLLSEASVRRRMEELTGIFPENQQPHQQHEPRPRLRKDSRRSPSSDITSFAEEKKEQRRRLAAKLEQIVVNNNHENPIHVKNRHHDHCSAIIKILPNASDIVFGHNTWDDFTNAAPRIFKHYSYTLLQESIPAKKFDVYFSSSPGLLGSVDDFYIVHGFGHLAVLETSLDINNDQLLNIVSPETMLYWTRASISNQLAHSGKSWAQIFSMHHSGTYANQWMVLDYQQFTPGSPPKPHFLTVLEEVPGYIHYEDMTQKLNVDGYWASYNNPYFDDIARITGQYQLCQKDINNCYDTDPRARIFRANHQRVENVTDLKYLMTYNDYQNDPISHGDPCNSIACRSDLDENVLHRAPFGAIDSKISSVVLSSRTDYYKNKPTIYIQFGPSHTQQKPFCWSEYESKLASDMNLYNQQHPERMVTIPKYVHNGHPDCYNYDWEKLPPVINPSLYN